MIETQRRRAVRAMFVGLVLTVGATIAPFVDRATSNMLAAHIENGYPSYSQARIETAVDAWLVILAVVGALGVAGWLWTIRAVRTGKRWARPVATTMFLLGASVALTALLVKDTSGDTALPPLLGWLGMLPLGAGIACVAALWRRPAD